MSQLVSQGISGTLPTSRFDLIENGTMIGFIQIRHRPSHANEIPAQMASHVYYEIHPGYRGRGYGKKILSLGLQEAKKLGLQAVIITCEEHCLASRKIIEANGGIFMEDVSISNTDNKLLKYKITLP